jgi:hypothetical protein
MSHMTSGNSDVFDQLVISWGAPIVARSEVGRFSGGLLHPRTCANYDSLGIGCKEKITIGGRVAYPTVALAEWLRERSVKGVEHAA